jgi:hypothetical protein
MTMIRAFRTSVTLLVLGCLVVVFAVWGWHAATAPWPAKVDSPPCVDRSVSAGDRISPVDVTVSVLNASAREGLAGLTLDSLARHHFAIASQGNAPKGTDVANAEIWTDDPKSPAAQLVHTWIPGSQIVQHSAVEPGITVVVGQQFTHVGGGAKSVRAAGDATICSPVVD